MSTPKKSKRLCDSDNNESIPLFTLESLEDMFNNLSQKFVPNNSDLEESIKNLHSMVSEKLDTIIFLLRSFKGDQTTNYPSTSNHTKSYYSKSIDFQLDKYCSDYKDTYFCHLRHADIAEIYDNNLKSEPIKVPHKFHVKISKLDSNEIIQNKKELCLMKVNNEINKLKILSNQEKVRMNEIENKVNSLCVSQKTEDEIRAKWNKMKEAAILKCERSWETKRNFFYSDKHLMLIEEYFKPIPTPMDAEEIGWTTVKRKKNVDKNTRKSFQNSQYKIVQNQYYSNANRFSNPIQHSNRPYNGILNRRENSFLEERLKFRTRRKY